jgi:hypothetical protein
MADISALVQRAAVCPCHTRSREFALQFAERCERVGIRTRRDGRKVYCLDVKLAADEQETQR